MGRSLSQQILASPGQPASVRIGRVDSDNPLVISAQGTEFNDVGFLQGYSPNEGDIVALLGQSSQAGSDPTSWLCLGSVHTSPFGYQSGIEPIFFTAVNSDLTAVTFPRPYPTGVIPNVFTNINSGAGVASLWHSRAINITETGFDMFSFAGTGVASTWNGIPVGWQAVVRTV